MSRKHLFTVSLVLPLMAAASGAVQAGQRITDLIFWPNEVRAQTQIGLAAHNALASGAPVVRPSANTTVRQQQCRYQGGPKSPMTCTR
ncbi:MAG: hypothetical protein AB1490_00535 [Pseudomonadota bacterium]